MHHKVSTFKAGRAGAMHPWDAGIYVRGRVGRRSQSKKKNKMGNGSIKEKIWRDTQSQRGRRLGGDVHESPQHGVEGGGLCVRARACMLGFMVSSPAGVPQLTGYIMFPPPQDFVADGERVQREAPAAVSRPPERAPRLPVRRTRTRPVAAR